MKNPLKTKRKNIKFLLLIFFLFFFKTLSFCSFQEVDLVMNDQLLGEVGIFVLEKDTIEVDSKEVVKLVKPFIKKEWQQRFEIEMGTETYKQLPIEFFEKIRIDFNDAELAVIVDVSHDILELSVTDLLTHSVKTVSEPGKSIQPQPFSAVCDLNITQGFRKFFHSKEVSQSSFYGSSNFKVNLFEALLDGYVYFLTMTQGTQKQLMNRINRGNISLNINANQGKTSFLFGDISPPAYFFQNSAPLFGMFVSNAGPGSVQGNSNLGPQSEHELFLNAPSTVDIYLNNTFQKTLSLSAGPHLLKNFPYAYGENQVVLKITDPMGNEKKVELNDFYSAKILPIGFFDYSIAVGFPRFQAASQDYTYEFGNPALSLTFQNGINQYFSLRSYFQASKRSLFSGINALHENRYFFLSSAIGGSLNEAGRFGWKGRLHFNGLSRSPEFAWSVTIEGYGKYFSYFLSRSLNNSQCAYVHASLSPKLGSFQTTVYGNFGWSRGSVSNPFTAGLSLSRKIFISTYFGLNLSYRRLQNDLKIFEAVFSLNVSPQRKDWKIQSNYNTNTKIFNLSGQYLHHFDNGNLYNMNLGFSQAERTKNVTGDIRYQGQWGEVLVDNRLYQNTLNAKSSSVNVNNVSTLASYGQVTAKTALVYAGKRIGFTKPFQGGFALVNSEEGSGMVDIEGERVRKKAYISPFSSAIITGLVPYKKNLIQIFSEDSDMSSGFLASSESLVFDVKNSTGFVAKIGHKKLVYYVTASLVSSLGKPIKHLSFVLKDQNSQHSNILGFTNKNGEFELLDVPSGTYDLVSKQYEKKVITIGGKNKKIILDNLVLYKK